MKTARISAAVTVIFLLLFSCSDDPCEGENCNGHGIPTDIMGKCLCDCYNGFTGAKCEYENLCITQSIECGDNGYCDHGTCVCDTGFEGSHCDSLTFRKYIGNYTATGNCTNAEGDTVPNSFTGAIEHGDSVHIILIHHFANQLHDPARVTIVSQNALLIRPQVVGGLVLLGEGTFDPTGNRIFFNYTFLAYILPEIPLLVSQCAVVLTLD